MVKDLPAEIWLLIFHYAVEDGSLFDYDLPTSLTESSWFKLVFGGWSLRSPAEALNLLQRRSYATKKAISSTCSTWRILGTEFLYRCLFFNDPTCIMQISRILRRDNSLGRWAKRLHITRFYASGGADVVQMQDALTHVIRCCPNLEIFIVNWPIKPVLTTIINALCTFCHKSLRTLHLNIPPVALPKVILMLESLPRLSSIHLEFDGPCPENIPLGATSDLTLNLTALEQLSLRGLFQLFVEQATGWNIPALRSLSLDFLSYRDDLPDIVGFLTHHGAGLTYLDLNCIPALDVPTILDLCPALTTFAFNPDWRLQNADGLHGTAILVHRPHQNILTIGCHQLLYAFGVGEAAKFASIDPVASLFIQRQNDMNFAALNKRNFPRLQRVRVLNRTLLRDLEAADGPGEGGLKRWERWWDLCAKQGIRLEDCTGQSLGTLPQDEEESESESESEVSEDESRKDEMKSLRDLLDQCRIMNATREEPFFAPQSAYERSRN
ncbi:uncharacterized protein FIBRA_00978 [Fibroporia radiculosa]|uniref:F-box domain-containing protein n=1 Tax=Fibroporia radiculosa TaxID=599839 RepID=J4GJ24_9APHY|nr:uncharacterized protein FIBRA_00978 [Fibroporia radiculosa]CCL98970.1 predicted protein [Fibroporia radiculosa]